MIFIIKRMLNKPIAEIIRDKEIFNPPTIKNRGVIIA
jgi:hypothetical protein